MKLKYKAVGANGKISRGLIEAKDQKEAVEYLRAKQLIPVEISNASTDLLANIPLFKKVKTSDVILFTRQLSSMLASGLTLMRSLEIFKEQIQNQTMEDIIEAVINDVQEGKTFSEAIAKHPEVFSPIYVSIVKAGESSGLLDKVLSRLADNLEKEAKLKGTIKSALMYPIIVIILMVIVVFIMMIFVIPQLTVLYQNLNVPLPLPTLIVVGMSNAFTNFWPVIIGIMVLVIVLYRKWAKTQDGQLIIDNVVLKLPIFGPLISQTILAEFARTFGLLVGTGTLVVEALEETANTAGNVHYRNAIMDVSSQVEKGVTIGDAMSHYAIFPALLVQLVKIGEQTGKIDETLGKASEYFEREVDQKVKNLTTAMEPFIMIVLGLGVAFLIISVITPIYSLISNIQ